MKIFNQFRNNGYRVTGHQDYPEKLGNWEYNLYQWKPFVYTYQRAVNNVHTYILRLNFYSPQKGFFHISPAYVCGITVLKDLFQIQADRRIREYLWQNDSNWDG